jgi:hypothetical protein
MKEEVCYHTKSKKDKLGEICADCGSRLTYNDIKTTDGTER